MSALLRGATTLASISRDLATRQRPRRVAHRRVKSHASKRRVESLRCVEGVPGASVSGSSLVYARGCGASISTRAIALEDAVPVTPAEIDAEQAKAKELFTHVAIATVVVAFFLGFPCASLAAAKANMAATIAPGPIPFLPFTHNQILHAVNLGSLPAWFALVFLPRWRHTEKITIGVAVAYSLLYATLAYVLFSQALFSLDFAAFTTVKGLSAMLAQSTAVLAGWAHFIVFDLFTARFFVLDSFRTGIPHVAVVPCILLGMFFGPVGLLTYGVVKKAHASWVLRTAGASGDVDGVSK